MTAMKLLILSTDGQWDSEMACLLAPVADVTALTLHDLDIADRPCLKQAIDAPCSDVMVSCLAWGAVERVETDAAAVHQTTRVPRATLNSRAIAFASAACICPVLPDRASTGDILILADRSTHLLLELPHEDLPAYVGEVIFKLQGNILDFAHVESCAYTRSDWHILDHWVQRGCLVQINASSLDHTRGDDVAQDLMDRGLIACTATDAHDATHRVPCCIHNEWGMSLMKEQE